ncbi:MAG: hypothetical protein ABFD50_09150 [Smithella sp.]
MREELEAIERDFGRHSPRLDESKPPEGWEYLWSIFWDIRNGIHEGLSGIKIGWRDILDYETITGYEFSAWETQAIMAMNNTLLAWQEEKRKEEQKERERNKNG